MSELPFPTPTLDKIHTVTDRSQAIGAFLEWLQAEQSVALMRWDDAEEDIACPNRRCEGGVRWVGLGQVACETCGGNAYITRTRKAWVPDGRSIEQLLAAYFDIDLDAAARERQAVFEHVAALAAANRDGES